ALGVAVQKGSGCELDIRFLEFLARSEALFHGRTGQDVTQPCAYHGCPSARRRGSKEDIKHEIGLSLNRDEQFAFQFVGADQGHAVGSSAVKLTQESEKKQMIARHQCVTEPRAVATGSYTQPVS